MCMEFVGQLYVMSEQRVSEMIMLEVICGNGTAYWLCLFALFGKFIEGTMPLWKCTSYHVNKAG